MQIKLKLLYEGKVILYLTEHTIENIKFHYRTNTSAIRELNKDIELYLKIDNSNINEIFENISINSEEEITQIREVDSLRSLFDFSNSVKKNYDYLDGELELINNSFNFNNKFIYKKLFVIDFKEEFKEENRNTYVYIYLREFVYD